MIRWLCIPIALAALLALGPFAGAAAPPPNAALVCEAPPDELSPDRLLRAISLDLRGQLPTEDEHAALADDPTGGVPADLVAAWLDTPEFADRMVRLHRELLWNNVADLNLVGVRGSIRVTGGIWFRSGTQATFYRGSNVRCLDEPASWTPDGEIATTLQPDGTRREGWVQVSPYWAPDAPVRVCAFDAQDTLTSPAGTNCASNAGLNDAACGCGPALRHCLPGGEPRALINAALVEDVDRRVRTLFLERRPYTELFTSRVVWVNGPLVHYWRHLRAFPRINVDPAPIDVDRLPDLAFTDVDAWVPVDMGPEHAGILTSPAFLLRFQTNRARANQYYTAFLCQPFNAPSGGIPVADADAQVEPDLQIRTGCDYCHALLEPAAAHWGRWGERGASWLGPDDHPPFDPACELCATSGLPCSARCRNFYVTDTLDPLVAPYVGWLNAYLFRRAEHEPYVEEGPRYLVYSTIVDGRLPTCVARTVAERLLGQRLGHDSEAWLEEVGRAFVASGYDYRGVVTAALAHPAYRRVR